MTKSVEEIMLKKDMRYVDKVFTFSLVYCCNCQRPMHMEWAYRMRRRIAIYLPTSYVCNHCTNNKKEATKILRRHPWGK